MLPWQSAFPPPSALLAFESAGRLLSFTAASQELGMTQAGISRHIKNLEEYVGAQLFLRLHGGVKLTPEGELLFSAVSRGVQDIAAAAREIRSKNAPDQVTITSTMGFVGMWLMPRMPRLRAVSKGISFHIAASDRFPDLNLGQADVAVVLGDGAWPGLRSEKLFEMLEFPVCSPSYRFARGFSGKCKDLLNEVLLHSENVDTRWTDWAKWFAVNGLPFTARPHHQHFNNYVFLIDAALSGEGIALGARPLIDPYLKSGALKPVIKASRPVHTAHPYYIVTSLTPSKAVTAVCSWLKEEAHNEAGATTNATR